MSEPLVCWKCGGSIEEWPLPLSRRAVCRACDAELHVCRLCRAWDPAVAGQCREDRAEDVTDKERANFCDWFQPRVGAWQPADSGAEAEALVGLAALFGEEPPAAAVAATERKPESEEEAAARVALERLFGKE